MKSKEEEKVLKLIIREGKSKFEQAIRQALKLRIEQQDSHGNIQGNYSFLPVQVGINKSGDYNFHMDGKWLESSYSEVEFIHIIDFLKLQSWGYKVENGKIFKPNEAVLMNKIDELYKEVADYVSGD